MEKISICIVDKNKEYRNSLVGYIQSYCRNYIIVLSEPESMTEDAVLSNDVVIMDSVLLAESNFRLDDHKDKVIVLSSDSDVNMAGIEGFRIFYRHSNISELISYIENGFKPKAGFNSGEYHYNTKFIVCLGLSGGAGTTSITSGIASQLRKYRDSRVFYMSLDLYESETYPANGRSHERILYHLIKSDFKNDSGTIASNFIETSDGVWRLPISRNMNLVNELDTNEKKQYINKILDGRQFDYVVVDCGNCFDSFTEYLLINAQDIVIVEKNDSTKCRFLKHFAEYIDEISNSGSRTIVVENFVSSNGISRYSGSIPIKTCLQSNNSKLYECMEFSTDIGKIVDHIG